MITNHIITRPASSDSYYWSTIIHDEAGNMGTDCWCLVRYLPLVLKVMNSFLNESGSHRHVVAVLKSQHLCSQGSLLKNVIGQLISMLSRAHSVHLLRNSAPHTVDEKCYVRVGPGFYEVLLLSYVFGKCSD